MIAPKFWGYFFTFTTLQLNKLKRLCFDVVIIIREKRLRRPSFFRMKL